MYKENTCMKHLLLYEVCYCAYQYSLCKKIVFFASVYSYRNHCYIGKDCYLNKSSINNIDRIHVDRF